ncbi:MAG: rod shape determining protein RodA, partial [Paraglaciecola sp.]
MLRTTLEPNKRGILTRMHCDGPLLLGLLLLMTVGLITIYSAGGEDLDLIQRQLTRLGLALLVMFLLAQVPVLIYQNLAVFFYIAGISTLIAVLLVGVQSKGAQRWLELGAFRFQPSEIMKLGVPMMIAWYV